MKYMLFLMLCISCTTEKTIQSPTCSPISLLEASKMDTYLTTLPAVLDFSKTFRTLPNVNKLTDSEYNSNFYEMLFQTTELSNKLSKSGFSNSIDFSQFHETVLDIFLFLMQEKITIESVEQQSLEIQKQIKKLQLKTAREPQNYMLKKSLSELICKEVSLSNILIVNLFKKDIDILNKNAEL